MGSFRDFKKGKCDLYVVSFESTKSENDFVCGDELAYSIERAKKTALRLLTELNLKLPTDYKNVDVVIRKVDFLSEQERKELTTIQSFFDTVDIYKLEEVIPYKSYHVHNYGSLT